MYREISILFCISLITSCISHKEINSIIINSKGRSIGEYGGTFSNFPMDGDSAKEHSDLRKLLFKPFLKYNWGQQIDYSGSVQISPINDKKIKVYYIKENITLDSCLLKVRLKSDALCLKRKIRSFGIPFVFFIYRERYIRLYIDDSNSLGVSTNSLDFGSILFFGNGSHEANNYTYKKLQP